MENDIIYTDLSQIDYSINQLENLCNQQQIENNNEVGRIIDRLTTENWTDSADSVAFKETFSKYQENLKKMASFYEQIINDLKVIRAHMDEQMRSRPNIHTEGF